eukprot:COSAG05_NODE_12911_length_449_cov_1.105714_1_plen_51_part_01
MNSGHEGETPDLPELAPGFKTLVSSWQCTTRVQSKDQNHGTGTAIYRSKDR